MTAKSDPKPAMTRVARGGIPAAGEPSDGITFSYHVLNKSQNQLELHSIILRITIVRNMLRNSKEGAWLGPAYTNGM